MGIVRKLQDKLFGKVETASDEYIYCVSKEEIISEIRNASEDMKQEVKKFFRSDLRKGVFFEIPAVTVHTHEELMEAIAKFYTPNNERLRKEMQKLFKSILVGKIVDVDELREIYVNCLDILKDFPISNKIILERLLRQCRPEMEAKQFSYVQIVDAEQDVQLHRLNEILKTVDSEFFYGNREFHTRICKVLEYWDELCRYPEIYELLAVIAKCNKEDHSPCDIGYALFTIKDLDEGISQCGVRAEEGFFPVNVSLEDRYNDVLREIEMYQGWDGYVELSGASSPMQAPGKIWDYVSRFNKIYDARKKEEITEEDIKELMNFERTGLSLFKSIERIGSKMEFSQNEDASLSDTKMEELGSQLNELDNDSMMHFEIAHGGVCMVPKGLYMLDVFRNCIGSDAGSVYIVHKEGLATYCFVFSPEPYEDCYVPTLTDEQKEMIDEAYMKLISTGFIEPGCYPEDMASELISKIHGKVPKKDLTLYQKEPIMIYNIPKKNSSLYRNAGEFKPPFGAMIVQYKDIEQMVNSNDIVRRAEYEHCREFLANSLS